MIAAREELGDVGDDGLDKSMGGGVVLRLRLGRGVPLDRREWGESASE